MYTVSIAVITTSMKIQFHKNDLRVQNVQIKDKTMSSRYPHLFSESKMLRLAHKSGR